MAGAVDQRNARHVDVAHGHHHLGAILGNALILVRFAYHEAGNVLQEEQRRSPLATQLDKVSGF
jgi:hypothetical protein